MLIHNLKFGALDRYGLSAAALLADEAGPRLLQDRRVRRGRAVARAAGLRPVDAGLWRADEPARRGRAAAGSGRGLDHRPRHRHVGGDRHSRGVAGAPAHRPRRGRRHLALRDGARLDDDPDRGLSRQWRDPGAARLRGRHDRALPGLRRRRRAHHGGGRQRQSVPPAGAGDRPAEPRRRPALSHQQGPRRQPAEPDPDPRRHLQGRADRRLGGTARRRRHPERPDPDASTRWSPTPQTLALGIIQKWSSGLCRWSGLPLSFDGARPPFAKPAPALGEDDQAIFERRR